MKLTTKPLWDEINKKSTLDSFDEVEEEIKEAARGKKNLKSMIWKNVISSQKIDLVSQAEAKSR